MLWAALWFSVSSCDVAFVSSKGFSGCLTLDSSSGFSILRALDILFISSSLDLFNAFLNVPVALGTPLIIPCINPPNTNEPPPTVSVFKTPRLTVLPNNSTSVFNPISFLKP